MTRLLTNRSFDRISISSRELSLISRCSLRLCDFAPLRLCAFATLRLRDFATLRHSVLRAKNCSSRKLFGAQRSQRLAKAQRQGGCSFSHVLAVGEALPTDGGQIHLTHLSTNMAPDGGRMHLTHLSTSQPACWGNSGSASRWISRRLRLMRPLEPIHSKCLVVVSVMLGIDDASYCRGVSTTTSIPSSNK